MFELGRTEQTFERSYCKLGENLRIELPLRENTTFIPTPHEISIHHMTLPDALPLSLPARPQPRAPWRISPEDQTLSVSPVRRAQLRLIQYKTA